MKVQRAGFVAADRRVIEVACDRTIDIPHEQPHDLIVDLGARHALGDLRVQLFGIEPGAADRREIDVAPHRRDRTEPDASAGKLDEQISFAAAL